jgi:hypothetical protein
LGKEVGNVYYEVGRALHAISCMQDNGTSSADKGECKFYEVKVDGREDLLMRCVDLACWTSLSADLFTTPTVQTAPATTAIVVDARKALWVA